MQSTNKRLLFFDIRPFAARLRAEYPPHELAGLSRAMLYPQPIDWGTGFYGDEGGSRWATPSAIATIDDTSGAPVKMLFSADVYSAAPGRWPFR